MKKLLILFAVVLLFAACETVEYDTFSTIAGTIIDAEDHTPIEGVSVVLSPSGKNAFTGSDGYFQFSELDAQQYTITAQKSGYATNRKTVTANPGETEDIVITMKKTD